MASPSQYHSKKEALEYLTKKRNFHYHGNQEIFFPKDRDPLSFTDEESHAIAYLEVYWNFTFTF
jgi:hypothetical protein